MDLALTNGRSPTLQTTINFLLNLGVPPEIVHDMATRLVEAGRTGVEQLVEAAYDWLDQPADYEGRLAHARDNPLWNAERRTPANSLSVSANGQITSEPSDPPPAKRSKIISSGNQETSSTNMTESQTVKDQPVVEPYSFLPFIRPNYFTVRLPYSNRYGVPALSDTSDTGTRHFHVYRFNLNSQLPDAGAATYSYNGWDNYGSTGMNYTYYRILATTVKVRVWHIGAGSAVRVMCGQEQTSKSILADPERWHEVPGYSVKDLIKGQADNSPKYVDFYYTYNPNQKRKDIRAFESSSTTQNVEGWTAVGSAPNLLDQFAIRIGTMRIKQAGAATNVTATGSNDIQYDITITATVQFRDSNATSTGDFTPDGSTQVTDTTAQVTSG
jgi:hypothetical protein